MSTNPKYFGKYVHDFGHADFPENSHTLVQRLHVYYLSFPRMKIQSLPHTAYSSKAAVIDAALMSSNVIGFSSFIPFKHSSGVSGYDAGAVTYFPLSRKECQSKSVLSITPFLEFKRCTENVESTICPRIRIPLYWCGFPPSTRSLELTEQLGFYDALCCFATMSSNQGGAKPPEHVQHMLCKKLRHFMYLRTAVETELQQQEISLKNLVFNYVVHFFVILYRFLFE